MDNNTPVFPTPQNNPPANETDNTIATPVYSATPVNDVPSAVYGQAPAPQPQADANSTYHYSYLNNNTPPYHAATGGWNVPASAPQPPQKSGKGGGKRFIASVALVVACAVAGFGGSYVAFKTLNSSGSAVIYKTASTAAGTQTSNNTALSVRDVAAQAGASVVSITTEVTTNNDIFGSGTSEGAGSGIVIAENGYILTNNHVIEGANTVKVTLPDGDEYPATIVGADEQTDIAVLKIEASGLVPAVIADSDTMQVGDYVLAIGNPLGTLGGTVTNGIISATNREITIDGVTLYNLLQMSAAVSPGNSGGGLFNENGELVAVVNAKSSSQNAEGLGFAIPVNTAMDVAQQLIEKGYVSGRPSLGVMVQQVDASQVALVGFGEPGVYIAGITQGSAAEKAGLERGDRIASVDGKEITTLSELSTFLRTKTAGETVEIGYVRDEVAHTTSLVLDEKLPGAA